jgi:glyoxylate/hydroxypyruvate reductase A
MKVLLCGEFDAGEQASGGRPSARPCPKPPGWTWPPHAPRRPRCKPRWWPTRHRVPAGLPQLRLIQSLWAGVDRLLADSTLPPGVPIARMVDPAMNAAMAETALWAVLALHRGFFAYARRQREGRWQAPCKQRADEVPVLVLGQGQMGRAAARAHRAARLPGHRAGGAMARPGTACWPSQPHRASTCCR